MLGDFNALKELEINAYLFNIDSNKPNPFFNTTRSCRNERNILYTYLNHTTLVHPKNID